MSVLNRAFVYLIFNMLIVPSLAAPAGSTLYEIIVKGILDFSVFVENFFRLKSGDLMITLVLQGSAFGFFSALNMFGDLSLNFFSTFVTHNYRIILTDIEPWRKEDIEVFEYGYFAAFHLTILAITFYYS